MKEEIINTLEGVKKGKEIIVHVVEVEVMADLTAIEGDIALEVTVEEDRRRTTTATTLYITSTLTMTLVFLTLTIHCIYHLMVTIHHRMEPLLCLSHRNTITQTRYELHSRTLYLIPLRKFF